MMIWKDLEIEPVLLKLEQDAAIIEEDDVVFSMKAGTYGVLVTFDKQERGLLIYGEGDYLVNCRIKTHLGVYSKQYVDKFGNFGVLITKHEKWLGIREKFTEAKESPKSFENRMEFIKKAENALYSLIDKENLQSILKSDWFFKVKAEKAEATLYYKGGKMVFKGCEAKLVYKDERDLVLKDKDVKLVLRGNNIVLKSDLGNFVVKDEKIVSNFAVIGPEKIVTKSVVGKSKSLADQLRLEALSTLLEALEKIGYVREA